MNPRLYVLLHLFCTMIRYIKILFIFCGASCLLVASPGCKSDDKAKEFDASHLYFDYQITGTEGNDNLTILLQYRMDSEDGDGMAIPAPGLVTIDGEVISVDSAKTTGYFYELHKPIDGFTGKHVITLKVGTKEYKEEFEFRPLSMQTSFSDTLYRDDHSFQFDGLEQEDFIRVLINDTSVKNDINRMDTVRNGQLTVSLEDLENLAPGPLQFEFIREYEREIKNAPEGGRLLIIYGVKREFFLTNN